MVTALKRVVECYGVKCYELEIPYDIWCFKINNEQQIVINSKLSYRRKFLALSHALFHLKSNNNLYLHHNYKYTNLIQENRLIKHAYLFFKLDHKIGYAIIKTSVGLFVAALLLFCAVACAIH